MTRTRLSEFVARGSYRNHAARTRDAEPSVTESLILNFVAGLLPREYLDNHLDQGAAAGMFSVAYARAAAGAAERLASLFRRGQRAAT